MADDQAKRATELETISTYQVPIPHIQINQQLKENIIEKWKQEWIAYPHARQSKYFLSGPDALRAKETLQLGKAQIGRLIRIITGHNALSYHRSKIDPENVYPKCRFCTNDDNETFIHLIHNCQRFEAHFTATFTSKPFDPPEI